MYMELTKRLLVKELPIAKAVKIARKMESVFNPE